VLYTTGSDGSSNISIVNMDGTNRQQLTFDVSDNFTPSASPDGLYIVFSSTRTGNRCIWRTDIDGSNPKQLTYGIDARAPDISPDGRWVVYWDAWTGTKSLWKVSIEGGDPVQLTDYYSELPVISPDGKQIAFVFLDERVSPKRKRIAVTLFEGGPPARVFDLPQPPGQTVGWTSDARALTYLDARNGVYNIWAQPLDGGSPRQLTNFTTDQIFAYAWSRDGKLLACARGNQKSDVVLISSIR
jgi:TolB protein